MAISETKRQRVRLLVRFTGNFEEHCSKTAINTGTVKCGNERRFLDISVTVRRLR